MAFEAKIREKKHFPKACFFHMRFFWVFGEVWVMPVNRLFLSRDLPENAFLGVILMGFWA